MKPVDQLICDDLRGDCLRACVASILEMPIDNVPNFADMGFFDSMDVWLDEHAGGRKLVWFELNDDNGPANNLDRIWFGECPEYMIAWGMSPRTKADGKPKQHAVVVQSKGYGVKLAHDPHPSRLGLLTTSGLAMIL